MSVTFDDVSIRTDGGDVPALVHVPDAARWLYVLAHGAGAGMRHPFMTSIAQRLAARSIATLRYEYPYMTARKGRPDAGPKLEACTRDVCAFAAREFKSLRLVAGGKSMGGRMTSQAQAAEPLTRVGGLIFLGFPLHGAGQPPNITRAAHLAQVQIPMLFLQGTRDTLADITLMRGVAESLGERVTLHVVEGADHGFGVLKSSGRTGALVLDELGSSIDAWLARLT
jgi:predicted alpha/beta-hydrolase family hydrolase